MDLKDFKKLAHDCSQGLYYLQLNSIYHFDIKPENILVIGDNYVIADFGMAKVITSPLASTSLKGGTPAFMSPQMKQLFLNCEDVIIDYEKCDVWSLGLTLLAAYTLTNSKDFIKSLAGGGTKAIAKKLQAITEP
jgi:serine/threonine protein kinase